jgi:hypothetical protein
MAGITTLLVQRRKERLDVIFMVDEKVKGRQRVVDGANGSAMPKIMTLHDTYRNGPDLISAKKQSCMKDLILVGFGP